MPVATPQQPNTVTSIQQIIIAILVCIMLYALIKTIFSSSLIADHTRVYKLKLGDTATGNNANVEQNNHKKQADEHHILYWSYEANQEELAASYGSNEHHRATQVPTCLQKINQIIAEDSDLLNHIQNDKNKLLADIQKLDDNNDKNIVYSTLDIMTIFKKWLEIARTYQPYLIKRANAVCLSTIDWNGDCMDNMYPQSRFVLLKQIELRKGLFIFYTNYNSNKSKQIESMKNKCASMTFYWHILFCSIRITGQCEKLEAGKSDLYWKVRPKKCKLSAITSKQSKEIGSKQQLDANYDKINNQFIKVENKDVPRPEWGGYQLKAHKIEFWKGDSKRFHDRIQFDKQMSDGDVWTAIRLQP